MELSLIKTEFGNMIDSFLERIKINHVVCLAPCDENGERWTEQECEKWIQSSSYNKISIQMAFFFNDHANDKITLQEIENKFLFDELELCKCFVGNKIEQLSKQGENLYQLNSLIRDAIKLLDANILRMNYTDWLKEKDPFNNSNIFFLVTDIKRVVKRPIEIDIQSHCMLLVDYNFDYRGALLYQLKSYLVDVYSTYLLLPSIGVNPKIKYDCSPTDICELILAISSSGVITESEKLKAILMDMFEIPMDVYNASSYSIRNRKKEKSVFVKSLSNVISTLPLSRKKNKSIKKNPDKN